MSAVILPPESLAWLRDQHATAGAFAAPTTTAAKLRELAALTPAWIQPYRDIAIRLADQTSDDCSDAATFIRDTLVELVELAEVCPQVVGVDFPSIVLSRAEWLRGNLHVEVDAEAEQVSTRTMLRIVGAEPRVWELNGIAGASMEFTQAAVLVTFPRESGELEFVAGSY